MLKKFKLRKTAAAVLALASGIAFAGTMGPVCAPIPVTVPCESCGWDFGVQALYLQHRGHEHDGYFLADSSYSTFGTSYGNRNFYHDPLDNDWDWGFKLEASYHFSTGNDINVNWYHYDESDDHDLSNWYFNSFASSEYVAGNYRHRLNPQWDAVNFEFGQMVNFGEHKVIRFHGGLQYARLERDRRWDITSITDSRFFGLARAEDRNEEFNGIGPRVGLDMAYHFGNGFAIYANGASALLVGENKFRNNNFLFNFYGNTTRDEVVPELEAKVGAKYGYATGSGEFTLDAGWMVVNYFHPLRTWNNIQTDFSLNGPYFGAKWVGTVA